MTPDFLLDDGLGFRISVEKLETALFIFRVAQRGAVVGKMHFHVDGQFLHDDREVGGDWRATLHDHISQQNSGVNIHKLSG